MDPIALFRADRDRARERKDACAELATIATVSSDGLPQARTMVLRDIGERLAVFTNATSPKWWECQNVGRIAAVVWLPSLSLQYRLACALEPVPTNTVHDSWQQRPESPKRLDWFYAKLPQSSAIANRQTLLDELSALSLTEPPTAPDTARGLFLIPETVDRLDIASEDGVHDRRQYQRTSNGWSATVLVP